MTTIQLGIPQDVFLMVKIGTLAIQVGRPLCSRPFIIYGFCKPTRRFCSFLRMPLRFLTNRSHARSVCRFLVRRSTFCSFSFRLRCNHVVMKYVLRCTTGMLDPTEVVCAPTKCWVGIGLHGHPQSRAQVSIFGNVLISLITRS